MRRLGPEAEEWVLAAACTGHADLFFAPDLLEAKVERRRRESQAKKLCQVCPVRADCLEEALASRERFGIWGGLTERERRAFAARRRLTEPRKSPQDIAGPGRPLSLPAVGVQGRSMSPPER